MLKGLEQSIFKFLYRKRTVRLAPKWIYQLQALMTTSVMYCVLVLWQPFDAWAERDRKTMAPTSRNMNPYKFT
jgi:hypothetical protein